MPILLILISGFVSVLLYLFMEQYGTIAGLVVVGIIFVDVFLLVYEQEFGGVTRFFEFLYQYL